MSICPDCARHKRTRAILEAQIRSLRATIRRQDAVIAGHQHAARVFDESVGEYWRETCAAAERAAERE